MGRDLKKHIFHWNVFLIKSKLYFLQHKYCSLFLVDYCFKYVIDTVVYWDDLTVNIISVYIKKNT